MDLSKHVLQKLRKVAALHKLEQHRVALFIGDEYNRPPNSPRNASAPARSCGEPAL